MDRSVVFAMGSPHSGTTLLTLILGSHSRAFALGEMEGFRGSTGCKVCDGPCPVWSEGFSRRFGSTRFGQGPGAVLIRANPFARGFYEDLFEITGADILVDSSKQTSWLEQRLAERRDWRRAHPFLIFITRDGRAAVNSWKRKYPETPVDEWAARWVRSVEAATKVFDGFDPASRMQIAYENLASNPAATARRLCAFLGIGFEPAMVDYWTHDHHVFKANLGTISLIRRHREELGRAQVGSARVDDRREPHYADLGQAIRLDERWRAEMTDEDLAIFDRVAGATNRHLAEGQP